MSAESVINAYLDESEPTLTLEALQVYVQEGVSIKPLGAVMKFMKQIKNMTSIDRFFSGNKRMVRSAAHQAVRAVDDDIFGAESKQEKTQQKRNEPTGSPAPKNDKQAESYLKRLYLYFKTIVKGLSFPEMKQVFRVAVVMITKMLIGVGLVGSAILTNGLAIPIALIIVILCILNAAEQTKDIQDETERINLTSAYRNVMAGFKKFFFSFHFDKEEGKFAIISTVILAVLVWVKTHIKFFEKAFTALYHYVGQSGAKVWSTAKGILGKASLYKIMDLANNSENYKEFEAAMLAAGFSEENFDKVENMFKDGWESMPKDKKLAYLKDKLRGGIESGSAAAGKKTKEFGEKSAKYMYWGLIVVGVATILYLFAEMVDRYNLKKVKEREDDREEFERTV
jgi:hypothetical protein